MNTALTAQPKSPRLIIGLRMRYEAAIYQVEIAPTTLNGLEGIDLLKPLYIGDNHDWKHYGHHRQGSQPQAGCDCRSWSRSGHRGGGGDVADSGYSYGVYSGADGG